MPKLKINLFGESWKLTRLNLSDEKCRKIRNKTEQNNLSLIEVLLESTTIYDGCHHSVQGLLNTYKNQIEIWYGGRKIKKLKMDDVDNTMLLFPLFRYTNKKKQQIIFTYQSYWDEVASTKNVEPFLLKEFKNRWYLIAKDIAKNEFRTYSLDRIFDIDLSKKKFVYPSGFNPLALFENSFGIIGNADDSSLETIVLSFDAQQGKYIKSLPLHHSQKIMKDDDDELLVQLKLNITFDFEMELLSFGSSVQVIEPQSLRDVMKKKLLDALNNYN